MIEGVKLNSNEVTRLLECLIDAEFKFFLTGSRFFNPTKEGERDWDFYAENSVQIKQYLDSLGFELTEDDPAYIGDPNAIQLYRIFPNRIDHIDVQLVDDIDAKHTVQRELKASGLLMLMGNKEYRKRLWHIGLNVYKAGKTSNKIDNLISGLKNKRTLSLNGGKISIVDLDETIDEGHTIESLIHNGELIRLIRWYRGKTGAGLKEAKDVIEYNLPGWKVNLTRDNLTFNTSYRTGGIDYIPLDLVIEVWSAGPGGRRVTATISELVSTNNKIPIIKWIRNTANLGLKEAKDLVEANWKDWSRQLGCYKV